MLVRFGVIMLLVYAMGVFFLYELFLPFVRINLPSGRIVLPFVGKRFPLTTSIIT